MNLFPRFSTLSPREWAIVIWFFAAFLYLVWLRVQSPKAPLWLRITCALNLLAALAVYRTVLW